MPVESVLGLQSVFKLSVCVKWHRTSTDGVASCLKLCVLRSGHQHSPGIHMQGPGSDAWGGMLV